MKRSGTVTVTSVDQDAGTITVGNPDDVVNFERGEWVDVVPPWRVGFFQRVWRFFRRELWPALKCGWEEAQWDWRGE